MSSKTKSQMDLECRLDQESENNLSFELVPKNASAARLIMEWRNDPVTLSQSFHSQPKVWPSFFDEFCDQYFADATLPCLFALDSNTRVGFLRFRRIEDPCNERLIACDISINIAPQYRGQGLGSKIVAALMPVLRGKGVERVLAEVKDGNPASVKMFENAGFRFLDEVTHQVNDTGEIVPVKRFIFTLSQTVSLPGGNRQIGAGHSCFVIAEAGSNWRMGSYARDMNMARALIDVALEAGADAVKFQTYRPETTYVSNAGESDYLSEAGIKESISKIFEDLAMPYEMVAELSDYCKKQQILFMSSPFSLADFKAVDPFVCIHKVASYEISHSRLIEIAASSGKPLILSTGASNMDDIAWAVNYFQSRSKAGICLMQCTARYPAPLTALNLGVIPLLKATFGVPVGLSDHSRDPIAGPLAAVALGADLIEKHYTLDNRLPGPDHAFAVNASELKAMVRAVRSAEGIAGSGAKVILDQEQELYAYARRGLQAIADIKAGESFVEGKNFDILRPGKQRRGMHPKHIERVSNGQATRNISLGDGIQEGDFSGN